jgi:anti-sigma regulatory factor (Ser/Thr protein kinase)
MRSEVTIHLELTLPAVSASVRRARDAVAAIFVKLRTEAATVEDARLCVSEAATNVVRHAYGSDGGEFAVTVVEEDGEIAIVVRDGGRGLSDFQQDGDLGYGLRIIERLAARCRITSAPDVGTEIEMVFPLRSRSPVK